MTPERFQEIRKRALANIAAREANMPVATASAPALPDGDYDLIRFRNIEEFMVWVRSVRVTG